MLQVRLHERITLGKHFYVYTLIVVIFLLDNKQIFIMMNAIAIVYVTDSIPTMKYLQCIQWKSGGDEKVHVIREISAEWKAFCHSVDCTHDEIKKIEESNNCQVLDCCYNAFEHWLERKNTREKTWRHLINCLENDMQFNDLAERLRECIQV